MKTKTTPNMETKKIIGLMGPAGSGKNAVASLIKVELISTVELALADPLKEFCQVVFTFPSENLWGASHLRSENFSDFASPHGWLEPVKRMRHYTEGWARRLLGSSLPEKVQPLIDAVTKWLADLELESLGVGLTPRRALQTLGTECGRGVDPDIWARYGVREADNFIKMPGIRAAIITDCRFVNEVDLVRAHPNGVVWLIDRPDAGLEGAAGQHASETEMRTPEMQRRVTRLVKNHGTIDDLAREVKKAVRIAFEERRSRPL